MVDACPHKKNIAYAYSAIRSIFSLFSVIEHLAGSGFDPWMADNLESFTEFPQNRYFGISSSSSKKS
jgi:hypothetical protein